MRLKNHGYFSKKSKNHNFPQENSLASHSWDDSLAFGGEKLSPGGVESPPPKRWIRQCEAGARGGGKFGKNSSDVYGCIWMYMDVCIHLRSIYCWINRKSVVLYKKWKMVFVTRVSSKPFASQIINSGPL